MSYTNLLVHCVFSTKGRRPIISDDLQSRLWAYMGGIARTNKFRALAVNGTRDHVHLLLSLPASMPVAKALQLIKSGSSKWIHEQSPKKIFEWQEEYGAFTIGASQVLATIKYIHNQREHHARASSHQEWLLMLEKNGLTPFEGTQPSLRD